MAKYRPNISRLYPQRQVPRPTPQSLAQQQQKIPRARLTPKAFSGLEFWYDPERSYTLISTNVDTIWDINQSGYNLVSNNTAERGDYNATGINSTHPCVEFTDTDFLMQNSMGNLFSISNAFTLAGVLRLDDVTNEQGIISVQLGASDKFQISIFGTPKTLNFACYNGSSWVGFSETVSTGALYFVYCQENGVNDPKLWINGTQISNPGFSSSGTLSATTAIVGSIRETSIFKQFAGAIGHLFMYSEFKSDLEVSKINNFLSQYV